MKTKIIIGISTALSILCLSISYKLFWNICVFVDESGSSITDLFGGEFWLLMNWLRLGLLAIIIVLSLSLLIFSKKNLHENNS